MAAKLYLGIDPGLSGALVGLSPDGGSILEKSTMPVLKGKRKRVDAHKLAVLLDCWRYVHGDIVATVEEVNGDPKWGKLQNYSFGEGCGAIRGVLGSMRIVFDFAAPKRWRSAIIPGAEPGKEDAIAWLQRAHPEFPLDSYSKALRSGIADAACLAEYGRRLALGPRLSQI